MALTKVIGSGVGELTNKVGLGLSSPAAALHVQTSTDGTGLSGDDIYVARFHNQEATSDKSFGVDIQAGSSTTDQALRIKDHDGTNTLMIVDGLGHITKPKQPAFHAYLSGNQDNFAINTNTTVLFDSERFDNNADFNTSNYTFTAPVTGKYQFNLALRFNNADTAAGFYQALLGTSNRNYALFTIDPNYSADVNYLHANWAVLADMDANDTAYIYVYQNNGGAQTDVSSGTDTAFSGYLVC